MTSHGARPDVFENIKGSFKRRAKTADDTKTPKDKK
jgi:hypothetical protein